MRYYMYMYEHNIINTIYIYSEAVISSIRIFRGHVSRVWSSQWLTPTHLISIGEDGTARVWNEHSCIHVERGHQVQVHV